MRIDQIRKAENLDKPIEKETGKQTITLQNEVSNLEQQLKNMEERLSAATEADCNALPIPVAPTTPLLNLKRSGSTASQTVMPNHNIDDSGGSGSCSADATAAKRGQGRPGGSNYQCKQMPPQPAAGKQGGGRPKLPEEDKKRRKEMRKAKKNWQRRKKQVVLSKWK